jgi:hypothetical protein
MIYSRLLFGVEPDVASIAHDLCRPGRAIFIRSHAHRRSALR